MTNYSIKLAISMVALLASGIANADYGGAWDPNSPRAQHGSPHYQVVSSLAIPEDEQLLSSREIRQFEIQVSDDGTVTDVALDLNWVVWRVNNVDVSLYSPDGTKYSVLHDRCRSMAVSIGDRGYGTPNEPTSSITDKYGTWYGYRTSKRSGNEDEITWDNRKPMWYRFSDDGAVRLGGAGNRAMEWWHDRVGHACAEKHHNIDNSGQRDDTKELMSRNEGSWVLLPNDYAWQPNDQHPEERMNDAFAGKSTQGTWVVEIKGWEKTQISDIALRFNTMSEEEYSAWQRQRTKITGVPTMPLGALILLALLSTALAGRYLRR